MEFVKHAINYTLPNGYAIFLLKIQFLEGKARYIFFKENPPKFVYVHSSRQYCAKNAEFERYKYSNAMCYGWFIWQKGFKADPKIRWIK